MKDIDDFITLESAMRDHVALMTKDVKSLFVTSTDRDTLWNLYLSSFPKGTNEIVKTRTEHDCSSCRHFIKQFGNVVSTKNGVVTSIWDFEIPTESRYTPVVNALAAYVKSQPIIDIATIDSVQIGVEKNFEKTESGIITWEHLHVKLPSKLVNCSRDTAATVRGRASELRGVFKRSLDEITEDSVLSALELISQNSLYKGEEWKGVLTEFQKHQRAYSKLSQQNKETYAWEQSVLAGPVVGKIRNHSIGVLLVDLSKGIDLDEAVRKYEAIVAPTNYKRPKAIFTKKMLEDAEKKITELGYLDSLGRRYATLEDISINDILYANRDVVQQMGGNNPFESLKKEVPVKTKNFDRVEEVSIDTFVTEILPTASNIEILLENKHGSNLVSLIAPTNEDSPSMFKWNNPFSWAYRGNIADSMKQRVKALGGDVTGVLRFSIQWNTEGDNQNDFDAHCIEPNRNEIYFGNKGRVHLSSGMLDVDIISPRTQTKDGIAVENITWSNKSKMPDGTYIFYVHNYNHHGGRSGFTAEIEFDGQIYSFAYNKELRQDEKVRVADVSYNKKTGQFTLTEKIPSSFASRNLWGLDTNQFQPVQVVMYSPNFWLNQESVGNKHYFFMLKGCTNEEQPNGFFNEYLKEDLLAHKRVFEALGSKMRVAPSEEQLSGLGFSSTQRNELVVKIEGHVNRTIKVVF